MTPSIFLVGEIILLLFILNKSFPLFMCLFHCHFQILIIEVDLGCSSCHFSSLAANRLRDRSAVIIEDGCLARPSLPTLSDTVQVGSTADRIFMACRLKHALDPRRLKSLDLLDHQNSRTKEA